MCQCNFSLSSGSTGSPRTPMDLCFVWPSHPLNSFLFLMLVVRSVVAWLLSTFLCSAVAALPPFSSVSPENWHVIASDCCCCPSNTKSFLCPHFADGNSKPTWQSDCAMWLLCLEVVRGHLSLGLGYVALSPLFFICSWHHLVRRDMYVCIHLFIHLSQCSGNTNDVSCVTLWHDDVLSLMRNWEYRPLFWILSLTSWPYCYGLNWTPNSRASYYTTHLVMNCMAVWFLQSLLLV